MEKNVEKDKEMKKIDRQIEEKNIYIDTYLEIEKGRNSQLKNFKKRKRERERD